MTGWGSRKVGQRFVLRALFRPVVLKDIANGKNLWQCEIQNGAFKCCMVIGLMFHWSLPSLIFDMRQNGPICLMEITASVSTTLGAISQNTLASSPRYFLQTHWAGFSRFTYHQSAWGIMDWGVGPTRVPSVQGSLNPTSCSKRHIYPVWPHSILSRQLILWSLPGQFPTIRCFLKLKRGSADWSIYSLRAQTPENSEMLFSHPSSTAFSPFCTNIPETVAHRHVSRRRFAGGHGFTPSLRS